MGKASIYRAYSVLNVKNVQEEDRVIEGIASTPTTDRMGDIVEPLGAQFKVPMPLLWHHRSDQPVGHVEFAKPTKEGIPFRARIAKIADPGVLRDRVDEAWQSVKAKLVGAVSIGFRPIGEPEPIKDTYGLRFKEWEWLELSLVTIPANSEATIQTIKQLDDAVLARRAAASGTPEAKSSGVVSIAGDSAPKAKSKSKGLKMKTIQEQIASFEAKRQADADRMTAIMAAAAEEGRTLDEAETEEYDNLDTEVKSLDDHLKRLRDHERTIASKAKPVEGAKDADSAAEVRGGSVISVRSNQPKGAAFTKYAMILAASKGNLVQAYEMSKMHKDVPQLEVVFKAAVAAGTTTDANWAGPLIPYNDMASEFIELLRPMTIVGKMQSAMRNVPFNVRMPRATSGASAGWVGQGAPKPVSALAFDTVSLPWSKIAVIIALTEELVRFSSPSAVAVCQQDMLDTISQFMDEQFIDPTVAISANVSPASVLNGVTATPSTGSTVAAILTDYTTLMNRFLSVNAPPRRGFWIMNPRTALYLSLLRTAQEVYAFPGITMDGGTFMGRPVITSNSVSVDYGSPSASYVAMVDAADILFADDGGVTLDVSREASLQMDSAPSAGAQALVSLWQNNLVGLRAERYVTWLKRRSSAAFFIDGVTY